MEGNKTIAYLGTLLTAELSEDSRAIDVTQLRLYNREQISVGTRCSYVSKTNCHFEALVEFSMVYFQELGMEFLSFLAINMDATTSTRKEFCLLILVNRNLQLYSRILLPSFVSKSQATSFDFKVLDGPSIFLLDKNHGGIYVCHHSDDTFKKYSFASFGVDSSLCSSYCIKSIASDSDCRTFCFVEMKLKSASTITSVIKIAEDGSEEKLDPDRTSDVLLPPKEYWQTLTAITYHKLGSDIPGEFFTKSSSGKETVVLLATEMKQFVISKGNFNILCCDIPFGDCLTIETIEVLSVFLSN